jgi:hypothetical protein
MKFTPRAAGALIALTLSAAALSGCVYYPSYGYGGYGGYGYGYAAPPVVVAPGPFIFGGYGGGWRGGYGRGGWR